MPDRGLGNEVQARRLAEDVAVVAIEKFAQMHPASSDAPKPEIPAIIKIAGGVISAVITAGFIGVCFWIVTTLGDLQQTVTRIDERQKLVAENGDARLAEIDRRVNALESYHRDDNGGSKK